MKMPRYSIARRYAYRGYRNFYGRVAEPGKPVRWISLGTKNKQEAEEWLRAAMMGRFASPEEKAVSLASASLKFLEGVESTHGSKSATAAAYSLKLGWFLKWASENGVEYLEDLDFAKASDYSLHLGSRYAPKTHREALRILRQFVSWSQKAYALTNWDPLSLLQPPKVAKRAKDFWTPDEVAAILEHAPDPDTRLFWAFMAYAGLRYAEALSMTRESIKDGMIRVVGKGNKEAFIPVGKALQKEIDRHPEWVFGGRGFTLNWSANVRLKSVLRQLGLDGNLHKFRHSFASNLLRANAPVPATARLMRHADATTTLSTYSHLIQEDLTKTADLL